MSQLQQEFYNELYEEYIQLNLPFEEKDFYYPDERYQPYFLQDGVTIYYDTLKNTFVEQLNTY